MAQAGPTPAPTETRGLWSTSEHERFLEAIALYPQGPWPLITAHIGTRSAKQVQTHAQKYQHKLLRHQRGLRKWKTKSKRPEHRVDATTAGQLMNTKGWVVGRSQSKSGSARPARGVGGGGGSPDSDSDYSDDDSDGSGLSDMEAIVGAIEPVPFQSAKHDFDGVSEPDDHILLEALAAILSWPTTADSDTINV